MLPANEHPDTAEVVFDTILAKIAVSFAFLTIIVPAIVSVLK